MLLNSFASSMIGFFFLTNTDYRLYLCNKNIQSEWMNEGQSQLLPQNNPTNQDQPPNQYMNISHQEHSNGHKGFSDSKLPYDQRSDATRSQYNNGYKLGYKYDQHNTTSHQHSAHQKITHSTSKLVILIQTTIVQKESTV
jgi:hypothetical protein